MTSDTHALCSRIIALSPERYPERDELSGGLAADVRAALDKRDAALAAANAIIAQQADEMKRLDDKLFATCMKLGAAEEDVIVLRSQLRRLVEALEPFAKAGRSFDESDPQDAKPWFHYSITIGDFVRAKTILRELAGGEGGTNA